MNEFRTAFTRASVGVIAVGGPGAAAAGAALLLFASACAETVSSTPSAVVPIATAEPPAQPKLAEPAEFSLNVPCESPRGVACPLVIVGVRLAPSETTVKLRLQSNRPGLFARIWPPGHPAAFRVRTGDGREHRLIRVEGVPLGPATIPITPGVSRELELGFEPVPIQTTSLDVLDGEPETGFRTLTFRFMNIKLDGAN